MSEDPKSYWIILNLSYKSYNGSLHKSTIEKYDTLSYELLMVTWSSSYTKSANFLCGFMISTTCWLISLLILTSLEKHIFSKVELKEGMVQSAIYITSNPDNARMKKKTIVI